MVKWMGHRKGRQLQAALKRLTDAERMLRDAGAIGTADTLAGVSGVVAQLVADEAARCQKCGGAGLSGLPHENCP